MQIALLDSTIGRPRRELRPDLRSLSSGNYVIFFRYAGEDVEIMRIIERHRDIGAQFVEEAD